jgi:NADH-quinone oxidoreductase subunit H
MDAINNLFKIIGDAIADLIVSIFGRGAVADVTIMALGAVILGTFCALSMLMLTYLERKLVARIQDRVGPNQAGPYGLLQAVADGVKMFTKETIVPAGADRLVYLLAPIIISTFAIVTYAVIPFAPSIVGTDLSIAAFYTIAVGSMSTIAILMAGWGSNNKFSLLGAFRTVAQLVGYEVPMLLNMIPVIMLTGSMSLVDIVEKQGPAGTGIPFILVLPLSALAFLISGVAETGRSPFDLIEAESEIVAGFHVEYGGMRFGMFMIGEYVNAFAVAFMFTTLFLGGYQGPVLPPYLWVLIKALGVFSIFIWFRGTLPRVRIDQLLNMNWKFLVPLSIVNIIMIGLLGKLFVTDPNAARTMGGILVTPAIQAIIMGVASLALLVAALALAARNVRSLRVAQESQRVARQLANRSTAVVVSGK